MGDRRVGLGGSILEGAREGFSGGLSQGLSGSRSQPGGDVGRWDQHMQRPWGGKWYEGHSDHSVEVKAWGQLGWMSLEVEFWARQRSWTSEFILGAMDSHGA